MGAMTLRILDLYLSFSPHPNISDGNFNLDHHFFRMQIFQINEKRGQFGLEQMKKKEKVTNQIFGGLQHRKNEVRYLENIFFRL